jgi:hypothetical protein
MYTTRTSPPTPAHPSVGRRQIITAAALTAVGIVSRSSPSIADSNAEILNAEEAIHPERVFNAGRQRVYAASIVRFELTDQGASTKLTFDHRAFPKGEAAHLATGWQENYWDPLTKFLA